MVLARRLSVLACALALLAAVSASAVAVAAPGAENGAAASKKKGKRCKKGFKPKTVTKKGKKTRVCRKVKKGSSGGGGGATGPKGIFEAPGQRLEGDAAKPFLQKYLLNSAFTDCPAGWPNCAVEQRYSHAADGTFYYCRLTSTSGADIRSVGEYGVDNARVEPDGSWIFHEKVAAYGNVSEYEWQVSASGVVTGAYRFQPGSAIEQIGPLQYVGGARDCSY